MAALALACWPLAGAVSAAQPFRTIETKANADAGRLKWLPHRPTMPGQGLLPLSERHAAKPPARFVQHSEGSPFSNPFGDTQDNANPPKGPGLVPLIPPGGSAAQSRDSIDSDPAYPPLEVGGEAGAARVPLPGSQTLTLAEELGTQAPDLDYECPSLDELKPINKITYRTTPEAGELPRDCLLGGKKYEPRLWAQTTFTWKASALCHKPLYFEDVHVERYGHSWGPMIQPVMSGAHFFGNVVALPYKLGMDPPWECMYTLGYYRPGNCAPYMLDPIPLSVRGAAVAGGIWAGGVYAIP